MCPPQATGDPLKGPSKRSLQSLSPVSAFAAFNTPARLITNILSPTMIGLEVPGRNWGSCHNISGVLLSFLGFIAVMPFDGMNRVEPSFDATLEGIVEAPSP